jgi:hypothetical protein
VPVRLPYEEVDVEDPRFPHRNPPVRNLHIYILERPQAVVQETLSVPGRYLQYGLTSEFEVTWVTRVSFQVTVGSNSLISLI